MMSMDDRLAYLRAAAKHGGDEEHELFWYCILRGCGCGSVEDMSRDAWMVFCAYHDRDDVFRKRIHEDAGLEILANWMYSLDLIEHGASIPTGWTTALGDKVWDIIMGAEWKG